MNAAIQVINNKKGEPLYAVILYKDYEKLLEMAEDLEDIKAVKAFDAGNEETFPSELVDRLIDGENPVRVFREHREMTRKDLAGKARVTESYLSQIESGKRKGTNKLKDIAEALNLTVDDLI